MMNLPVSRHFRLGAFATGGYLCKCVTCGDAFEGDKRAMRCLPCSADKLGAEDVIGEFGALLRKARGALSLSKAAAKIGCTKAHLWEMEMGHSRNPTVQTLAGIASAYGVTISHLALTAAASLTNAAASAAHAAPVPQPFREASNHLPPNHEGGR